MHKQTPIRENKQMLGSHRHPAVRPGAPPGTSAVGWQSAATSPSYGSAALCLCFSVLLYHSTNVSNDVLLREQGTASSCRFIDVEAA